MNLLAQAPLVSCETLNQQLSNTEQLILFDVRFALADVDAGRRGYDEGHLPGAYYLHLDDDLSGEIKSGTGRHPLPQVDDFVATLNRCGMTNDSVALVYDDGNCAFASRLWWMLRWLGHDKTVVLEGGFKRWTDSRLPTTSETPAQRQGTFKASPQQSLLLSAEQVQTALRDDASVLVDARMEARFRGDVEPIDPVAGHVPGAINRPFLANLNDEGMFQTAQVLKERHQPTDGRSVVHMCGSGVTACHNILASVIAGCPMPKLYPGSWSEWIRDESRGVATGND